MSIVSAVMIRPSRLASAVSVIPTTRSRSACNSASSAHANRFRPVPLSRARPALARHALRKIEGELTV
jgi:hypothetical protein